MALPELLANADSLLRWQAFLRIAVPFLSVMTAVAGLLWWVVAAQLDQLKAAGTAPSAPAAATTPEPRETPTPESPGGGTVALARRAREAESAAIAATKRMELLEADRRALEERVAKLGESELQLKDDLRIAREFLRQRRVNSDQRAFLVRELQSQKDTAIKIISLPEDAEAERFATDLETVLREAGWKPERKVEKLVHNKITGLIIAVPTPDPPEAAALLQTTLNSAGLRTLGALDNDLPIGRVVLIVGPKP